MWNPLISPMCQNVLTNKNKFQIQFSSGNYFSKCTIFYRCMGTSSKVTHTKYAVAETHISSVRLITVIHVLKLFLRPLLTMYFSHWVSDFKLMLTSYYMSETDVTAPFHPTWCLLNQDFHSPWTSTDKCHKLMPSRTMFLPAQLYCWPMCRIELDFAPCIS